MNEQVLSIEKMQEVEDLGIDTSKASMCWGKWNSAKEYHLFAENKANRESFIQNLIKHNCINEEDAQEYAYHTIPTFTLQDILSMLPIGYHIETDMHTKGYIVYSIHQDWDNGQICWGDNLLEVAFNMLKWCKQNNYI